MGKMSEQEKMDFIAEALDVDVSGLSVETELESLEEWDSVAVISFIAMMDDELGVSVKGDAVRANKTVGDLVEFIGNYEG